MNNAIGKTAYVELELFKQAPLINGVQHFYQSTKPTVRPDGSALVAYDRWYKTDDGTSWFWNGTYWLSPSITKKYEAGYRGPATGNVALRGLCRLNESVSIASWFIHRVTTAFVVTQDSNPSNYIMFRYFFDSMGLGGSGETGTDNVIWSTISLGSQTLASVTYDANLNLLITPLSVTSGLGFQIKNAGTAIFGGYIGIVVVYSAVYS